MNKGNKPPSSLKNNQKPSSSLSASATASVSQQQNGLTSGSSAAVQDGSADAVVGNAYNALNGSDRDEEDNIEEEEEEENGASADTVHGSSSAAASLSSADLLDAVGPILSEYFSVEDFEECLSLLTPLSPRLSSPSSLILACCQIAIESNKEKDRLLTSKMFSELFHRHLFSVTPADFLFAFDELFIGLLDTCLDIPNANQHVALLYAELVRSSVLSLDALSPARLSLLTPEGDGAKFVLLVLQHMKRLGGIQQVASKVKESVELQQWDLKQALMTGNMITQTSNTNSNSPRQANDGDSAAQLREAEKVKKFLVDKNLGQISEYVK